MLPDKAELSKEQQFIEDAKEDILKEAAKPRNTSPFIGYVGVGLGLAGFILPVPLQVLMGIFALMAGVTAMQRGHRKLGMTASIIGFIDLLSIFLSLLNFSYII